ncbi:MAG TPA: 16S rRNA (guanine(527)-N(7))-methyltransferase RsmG [Candidatus Limnocylindrales bacterium]
MPRDVPALPALPPVFRATLDRGLTALGLHLPAAAQAAIDDHVRLLLAWNASINLTAITDPAAIATRHVLDSLAATRLLGDGPHAIADLGSGAGFPGLPLAAALPDARVSLVDSVGKKGAFLEVAVAATGLGSRVAVRIARAETLERGAWDVVTARAVGSLPDLVELALPLLRVGGRLVAWKRGDIRDELASAARAAAALGGGMPDIHPIAGLPDLAGHVLVTVTKRSATPAGFPRDPGRRARQAW